MKSIRQFRLRGGLFHWAIRAAAFAALLPVCAGSVQAAELVLFQSETCEWCERFNNEIGPVYPNTSESACAPLRRVDIHDPRPPDLAHIKGVVYTPTFVLVEDGREIGRLTGYPGEDFFWSLLGRNLKKLRHPCALP